jgi:hypothetical protein
MRMILGFLVGVGSVLIAFGPHASNPRTSIETMELIGRIGWAYRLLPSILEPAISAVSSSTISAFSVQTSVVS